MHRRLLWVAPPGVALLAAILVGVAAAQSGPAAPRRYATLPAVSPDGKRVAYVRELAEDACELRVVGLDGTDDRLLWHAPGGGGVPGWMPGGRRVSFVTSRRDTATLWSVPLDGGSPRLELQRRAKALSLSRDGRRVAYLDGDWQRGVLRVGDLATGRVRSLSDSTSGWFNIAWSPGDRAIAATRLGADRQLQVWWVDARSGRSRVVAAFDSAQGRPQWPTWSPDGRRIAVQAGRYDRQHPERDVADVWIVDVASRAATRLETRSGTWMDETPSWCPDGRRIVFQSSRTGRFEVWRVNTDGSGPRSLTP